MYIHNYISLCTQYWNSCYFYHVSNLTVGNLIGSDPHLVWDGEKDSVSREMGLGLLDACQQISFKQSQSPVVSSTLHSMHLACRPVLAQIITICKHSIGFTNAK